MVVRIHVHVLFAQKGGGGSQHGTKPILSSGEVVYMVCGLTHLVLSCSNYILVVYLRAKES